MKLAYFIMTHHKPQELLRLLNAIYSPDNIYMIHVDGKAERVLHDVVNSLCQDNVNILNLPSRCVTWAGWSLVQVELDAIREFLHEPTWTHYINLSGQCFPLVRQSEIMQRIEPGKNYIYSAEMVELYEKVCLGRYCVEDVGQLKFLRDRPAFNEYFAAGMKPFRGSQWKCITREFAAFAVNSPFAFELQEYFRNTLLADESYFPTLIQNSNEFKGTLINDSYRYIRMQDQQEGLGFRRPETLTMKHLPEMLATDRWFIRKFDLEIDSELIDIIEARLMPEELRSTT